MSRKTEGKYKKIKDNTSDHQSKEGHNEKEGIIINTQKKYSTSTSNHSKKKKEEKQNNTRRGKWQ